MKPTTMDNVNVTKMSPPTRGRELKHPAVERLISRVHVAPHAGA